MAENEEEIVLQPGESLLQYIGRTTGPGEDKYVGTREDSPSVSLLTPEIIDAIHIQTSGGASPDEIAKNLGIPKSEVVTVQGEKVAGLEDKELELIQTGIDQIEDKKRIDFASANYIAGQSGMILTQDPETGDYTYTPMSMEQQYNWAVEHGTESDFLGDLALEGKSFDLETFTTTKVTDPDKLFTLWDENLSPSLSQTMQIDYLAGEEVKKGLAGELDVSLATTQYWDEQERQLKQNLKSRGIDPETSGALSKFRASKQASLQSEKHGLLQQSAGMQAQYGQSAFGQLGARKQEQIGKLGRAVSGLQAYGQAASGLAQGAFGASGAVGGLLDPYYQAQAQQRGYDFQRQQQMAANSAQRGSDLMQLIGMGATAAATAWGGPAAGAGVNMAWRGFTQEPYPSSPKTDYVPIKRFG